MSEETERLNRTRERELARVGSGRAGRLPDAFTTALAGCSFVPHYPENLHDLEVLNFEAEERGERLACVIVRNPDNPYDANACEVHVPALGEAGFIGHIPKALAARLAARIDSGERFLGEVSGVRINPDHLDRPGIDIHLQVV